MEPENSRETKPKRKSRKIVFKIVLLLVLVFILSAFFLIPVFLSSQTARQIILAKVNESVDGKVDLAGLSMNWGKGIKVTDVTFNDDAGQISVTVKQITAKPRYGSILRGTLSFGKTIIDEPKVEINLNDRQVKKKRSLRYQPTFQKTQAIALPISKIDIVVNNGSLKISGLAADNVEARNINSELTINPAANLNTNGKLDFEQAHFMGLDFGSTKVKFLFQDGILTISPFSSPVNNGRLNFAAHVDFNQSPAELKIPQAVQIAEDIQIDDRIGNNLLMYLNPIFANAFNISGRINFNCQSLVIPMSQQSKNDIEVIGTISIDQFNMETSDLLSRILSIARIDFTGQEIRIHPIAFVLQDGFLRYDDMQIDVGNNPINFKGVIGLDKTLNMTVTLPYTLKGKTAKVDKETVGKRISLPLGGTVDKPQLDLSRMAEEQLKGQLEQLIDGQVEDKLKSKLEEKLGDELTEKALEVLGEFFKEKK